MNGIKTTANTVLFGLLLAIMVVAPILDAASDDLWTSENVTGYITPTNATMKLCIGTTCNTGYEVSINTNASISNSPICTRDNGYCLGASGGTDTINNVITCDGNCTTVTETAYSNGSLATNYCTAISAGTFCLNSTAKTLTFNGTAINSSGGGGGNPFDQWLNTTNDVRFNSSNTAYGISVGLNYTDAYGEFLNDRSVFGVFSSEELGQYQSTAYVENTNSLAFDGWDNYLSMSASQSSAGFDAFWTQTDFNNSEIHFLAQGGSSTLTLTSDSSNIYIDGNEVVSLNKAMSGDINISGTVYYGALQANSPILETTDEPFVTRCTIASDGSPVVAYIGGDEKAGYKDVIERVDPKNPAWYHQACYEKRARFDLLATLQRSGAKKTILTTVTSIDPASKARTTTETTSYRAYTIADITFNTKTMQAAYDSSPEYKNSTTTTHTQPKART